MTLTEEKIQKQQFPAPKTFFSSDCQKLFTFFSYHRVVSFTVVLQCYCFLRHVTLYQLSRTIGKGQDRFGQFFWSQKEANYLGVKLKLVKRGKNRVRFQPINATEESVGHCSRNLWLITKFFPYTDTNKVQRHG